MRKCPTFKLVDCHLLKEVYVNLLDQKEPKLNLESKKSDNFQISNNKIKSSSGKIIKPSEDELRLHKKYLQSQLPKNNYN